MRGFYAALTAIGLTLSLPGAALAEEADPAAGEKLFARCKACHTLDEGGKNGIGPNLHGLFGRTAGSVEGVNYSKAMKAKGEEGLVWNEETLSAYLERPAALVKGTNMAFPGLKKPEDRANLIAYLKQETGAE
ncbi:cytochrome c family protein [uncultured Parvibaculum sp.]|uniref:c-type cytochrome n=1 Tax=uncultured Parvibaculum sp. TaxID=291828 RepID=UPI0030D79F80|tara:strand:- start:36874 stop:37272 length:399 start_codon:yes stop_codon:yes gene_type:complete